MAIKLSRVSALQIFELGNHNFNFHKSRENTLENIKLINIIIGANNSGKSRLLRECFFYSARNIDLGANLYNKILHIVNGLLSNPFDEPSNNIKRKLIDYIKKNENNLLDSNIKYNLTKNIEDFIFDEYQKSSPTILSDIITNIFSSNILNEIENASSESKTILESIKTEYIPILRGLRTLDINRDVYRDRTIKDYFTRERKQTLQIFTGHTLYDDMVHALLGLEEERESVRQFENYLSKHFFEGKSITIIPKKDRESSSNSNNVVYVKIGNEPLLPIYELGDGIQAIITLTIKPFLTDEPTIFFIEEPEHNLHAGMQRALLEAFRARPQHMYFFTTQSNHFIDLTLGAEDINLISVTKSTNDEGKSQSIIQNQAENSLILKELGVLASSVLLANCSIWIEGVTDKRYLQIYMAKFIDELKTKSTSSNETLEDQLAFNLRYKKLLSYNENLHYVFVEYQGSNITHWAFTENVDPDENSKTPAKKLNKNIFLLADADIETKGSRVEDLNAALGDDFCLLEWKEIENYIPQDILIKTAETRWNTFNGNKNCNISFNDLPEKAFEQKEQGIGEILETMVVRSSDVKAERKFFEADSGTIKDKVKFCDTAVSIMQEDQDWKLTPQLEKLCDTLWSFVEKSN